MLGELNASHVGIYQPLSATRSTTGHLGVRFDRGEASPLSAGNNEEIRILREKHKELWKFYVLIDRDVWDRRDRVHTAAAAYTGFE